MLVDDPKDRPDEPDDVELDDDAEAVDEETEDESPDDETAEREGDDETADEVEEPEEKPEKITLTRAEYDALQRGEGRRQPPTERPDPLAEAYDEMLKDEKIPVSVKKVISGLAGRMSEAVQVAEGAKRELRQFRSIPDKRRDRVEQLVDKFGLPPAIAHQLHKGELYDKLVEKKRAKRAGGGKADEVDTTDRRPAPQRGSAQHTSTTRAVRREDASPGGKTVSVKGHPGLKVPLEFPNSTAYERFMDGLTDDAHKRVVLNLRRNGVAGKIRGHG
jgi:hypothetical protein